MTGSRRWFLQTVTAGWAAWLAGCGKGGTGSSDTPKPARIERIDQALTAAAAFLLGCQSDDGGWRSDVYGPFKEGPALTPLVLRTVLSLPAGKDVEARCRKGSAYLAAQVQGEAVHVGPHGLGYPVYSSAGAVWVLSQPCNTRHCKARDVWLAYLRERQLTEDLGWSETDKPYGGWGYSPRLPRKPKPGEPLLPLTESNLSATLFALEALHAAGVKPEEPLYRKALVFVQRCQNDAEDPKTRDPAFDDGGFFFIYDDPVRNKAGAAGKDRSGRERYFSYGSTTADGLRALLLCGTPADASRVVAARSWLETNFRGDRHPGRWQADREHNRGAVYYYYCCSAAQAFLAAGLKELQTAGGKVLWAEVLSDELIRRQGKDGSWCNPLVPQREDDPLVASSLAGLALACCRESLTGNKVRAVTDP
jgi:Prenyltransferase and squalene oxidase repeat